MCSQASDMGMGHMGMFGWHVWVACLGGWGRRFAKSSQRQKQRLHDCTLPAVEIVC